MRRWGVPGKSKWPALGGAPGLTRFTYRGFPRRWLVGTHLVRVLISLMKVSFGCRRAVTCGACHLCEDELESREVLEMDGVVKESVVTSIQHLTLCFTVPFNK